MEVVRTSFKAILSNEFRVLNFVLSQINRVKGLKRVLLSCLFSAFEFSLVANWVDARMSIVLRSFGRCVVDIVDGSNICCR